MLNDSADENTRNLKDILKGFYNFCFELPLDNMIRDAIKFK